MEFSRSVVFPNDHPTTRPYLTFDLDVTASHLFAPTYNDYQQFLYDTITDLRQKGWYFERIADWLNENGYPTVRGKTFRSGHVHSIVKKKRIRDERLNALPEDRFEITSPLRIEYVERKYINSD